MASKNRQRSAPTPGREPHEELDDIAERLDAGAKPADGATVKNALDRLEKAANEVGKAWSGSAIGYHARVYYSGLRPPLPGAHFSAEWGWQRRRTLPSTTGDWAEQNPDDVERVIQGRLGFAKAIILLEEGCEEFSNIHGLGQIRFPKGNISAKFDEIRRVLEREGLVKAL